MATPAASFQFIQQRQPSSTYPHSLQLVLPEPIDLAVIVVPPKLCWGWWKCGKQAVRGLVVITAGFKEDWQGRQELKRKLIELVRARRIVWLGRTAWGSSTPLPG